MSLCMTERGRKTGRERKEDVINSEKGERGPPGSQEKTGTRTHSESTGGLETREKQTPILIHTLNNNNLLIWSCGYCTAPNKILPTVRHIHYSSTGSAENDGKGQHILWK